VNTFDIQNYDVYLTGESYAGYYVPYIADTFISKNDTEYYNLKGVALNNPIIGDATNQQHVVIVSDTTTDLPELRLTSDMGSLRGLLCESLTSE
jgi:carboxypeptidase C (cathepsin A)